MQHACEICIKKSQLAKLKGRERFGDPRREWIIKIYATSKKDWE
jgi:hypothetical protein